MARSRIVSVAVLGDIVSKVSRTASRLKKLDRIVEVVLAAGWAPFDALLLPAGFTCIDAELGRLDLAGRIRGLEASVIAERARAAAARLQAEAGALLILGVETAHCRHGFSGDQLYAAWSATGIVGVARKAFPARDDTYGTRKPPYLLQARDATAEGRILRLFSGARAFLCVCYDAFAFAEARLGPTAKRGAMRYLGDGRQGWRMAHSDDRERLMMGFYRSAKAADLLVGIHGFNRPGRELYWQRHGLATASAALGGAAILGAAHFRKALPSHIGQGLMAAHDVPPRHLRLGLHRPARRLPADDFLVIRTPKSGRAFATAHLVSL